MYGEKSKFKEKKTFKKGIIRFRNTHNFKNSLFKSCECIQYVNISSKNNKRVLHPNNPFLTRKIQKSCLKSDYNEKGLLKVNKGGI